MSSSHLGISDGVKYTPEDFQEFIEEDDFLPRTGERLHRWIGRYPLGQGGQGMVGLWIGVTREGRVTRRLTIKRSRMSNSRWKRAENWVLVNHGRERVPMAVHAHRTLSKLSKRHFLQHLGHRMEPEYHQFLTFAEFCPYGSLDDLLVRLRLNAGDNGTEPHIPEAWLWFLFHELAEANNYMANAVKKKNEFAVHCDLKPDNVFLVEPDKSDEERSNYPIPKIGDFDSCRLTTDNPAENPRQFLGNSDGTYGHMPPEQLYWYEQDDRTRPYLPGFNTFQIGVTMLSLLEVETNRTQVDFDEEENREDDDSDDDEYLGTHHLRGSYSDKLIDLIDQCIEHRPEDRIDPHDLLVATRDGAATSRRSTLDTRVGSASSQRSTRAVVKRAATLPLNLPITFRDDYKLGLSVKRLPGLRNVKLTRDEPTTYRRK